MSDLHEIKTTNDAAREVVKASLLNALTDPEMLDRLVDALTIEPCHVTGMHDPTHTEKYLCDIQHSSIVKRLLKTLGLTSGALPKRLHETCGWCHDVPIQEEYREQNRALYRWAGVEIPETLAAPAPDAAREGDDQHVQKTLARLHASGSGWVKMWVLDLALEHEAPEGWNVGRRNRAIQALKNQGLLEHTFIDLLGHVRLTESLVKG